MLPCDWHGQNPESDLMLKTDISPGIFSRFSGLITKGGNEHVGSLIDKAISVFLLQPHTGIERSRRIYCTPQVSP